jgi:glycosyltransferase involved in cell wall biosynthesis
MKEILIAIDYFPPAYTGAGLRASRLIDRLKIKYNMSFKVLSLNKSNKATLNNTTTLNDKNPRNTNITKLNAPFEDGWFFPIFIILLFFKINYYMIKNRKRIETIHFFSFSWFNRILMFSNILFYKKKTILEVTLDGSDDPISLLNQGIKNKLFRWLTLYLLRCIDQFMVPSKNSLNAFQQCNIPIDKIWVRPHPVDENLFGSISLTKKTVLRQKLKLPKKYLLLSIGMLCSRKNQLFLVKAINHIKNKNIILIIIGPESEEEPEYAQELNKYICDNNLEKQIIILNSRKNINEYMIAADLFVFASKSEGFPNVIAEATTSGLPFVTLHLDCLEDILTDKIGIVLPNIKTETNLLKKYCLQIKLVQNKKIIFNRYKIRQTGKLLFSSKIIDHKYFLIYKNLSNEIKNQEH